MNVQWCPASKTLDADSGDTAHCPERRPSPKREPACGRRNGRRIRAACHAPDCKNDENDHDHDKWKTRIEWEGMEKGNHEKDGRKKSAEKSAAKRAGNFGGKVKKSASDKKAICGILYRKQPWHRLIQVRSVLTARPLTESRRRPICRITFWGSKQAKCNNRKQKSSSVPQQ